MHLIHLFVIPRISSSLLKPVSFLENFGYLIYNFLSFLFPLLSLWKKMLFTAHFFTVDSLQNVYASVRNIILSGMIAAAK